jgi:PAS domain S-box-containing protein
MTNTKHYTFAQMMRLKSLPVIAIDEHSMITYINAAFEQEFGWTSDELIGQSLTTIIPSAFRTAHDIGMQHSVAQQPKDIEVQHDDFSVLRKDGSEQWCTHTITGKFDHGSWTFAGIIEPSPMPLQNFINQDFAHAAPGRRRRKGPQ